MSIPIVKTVIFIASLLAFTTAQAQSLDKFPSKQVAIIFGFAPGGGGDISSRWIADFLKERWKVPVLVDNKPGAGAMTGIYRRMGRLIPEIGLKKD
jgi:tripartite-type tricarboxylate transporter receptor subunit TctC